MNSRMEISLPALHEPHSHGTGAVGIRSSEMILTLYRELMDERGEVIPK